MKEIRNRARQLILATIVFTASGCGTIFTLNDGGKPKEIPYIYSGVATEKELLSASFNTEYRLPWWALTFIVIDLPLSAAGDTLCLPFTATRAIIESKKQESNKAPGSTR